MWRVRQPVTALISSHLRRVASESALEGGTLLRYDQWDDIGRHDFHWCWVRLAVLTGAWAGSCVEWAPVSHLQARLSGRHRHTWAETVQSAPGNSAPGAPLSSEAGTRTGDWGPPVR
jgi:hypothetical protein